MSGRDDSPVSHSERLGRAIQWLAQQERDDHAVVEEACQRFDLSPTDEEFLQKMWRQRSVSGSPHNRSM